MGRRTCVLIILFCLSGPGVTLAAQDFPPSDPADGRGNDFRLEQNYPNPFNPETTIPFVLEEDLFRDGRPVTVSLRVYNVLQEFVATPVALDHPDGEGAPVQELPYPTPGRYEAHWDGRDRSGREVASGVYFLQLVVDGRAQVRKMFVTK